MRRLTIGTQEPKHLAWTEGKVQILEDPPACVAMTKPGCAQ